MRLIATAVAALFLPLAAQAAETPSIPYEVLQRSELGSIKLSLDVQVPLVDGQLPSAEQIGEVSQYLVSREQPHDRAFVTFYLPEMKVGAGAYATAHNNPEMQVQIQDFMLMQYPQYLELLDQ
jgi:hypothetical protein